MKRAILPTLLSGVTLAAAPSEQPVQLTATTRLVVTETRDGKTAEYLRDASGVTPGDLLELAQTLRNTSGRDVQQLNLNLPLDRSLTFQSAACTLGGVVTLYSLDGKVFAKAPLMKTVTVTENGRQVQKQVVATPAEYRAVRWQIPTLKAGQSGRCAVRAVVR